VKVGATWLVTTIDIVVAVPHWPEVGVKLYVVVPATAVLIVAGFHVPVTPLLEVTGKAGAVLLIQSGPIAENAGVTWLVTSTAIVTVAPHWAPDGVNVYVVVPVADVLIFAGLQVPDIPFVDVAGSAGAVEFWHKGPICVNVGVTCVVITIDIVVLVPHCPPEGVNVYVVVPTDPVLIVPGLQVPVIPLIDAVGNAGAVEL
jgi:hypothetical protein